MDPVASSPGHLAISRRVFVSTLGRATIGFAVLGVAGCSTGSSPSTTTTRVGTSTSTLPAATAKTTTSDTGVSTTTTAPLQAGWQRVELGGVSAYVLVRNGEAVVIDTGNPGSAIPIENTLEAMGVGWSDVGHIVVTHRHPDHIGSLPAVADAASAATIHAGALDIPQISVPREIAPVGDGDDVFGLRIIETPGHTAGHISALDPELSVLFAGDALNGGGGGVLGPNPQFTDDLAEANASVVKLGGFEFEAVTFGHGDPVLENGTALVSEVGAGS